jgi:hypothetical protein
MYISPLRAGFNSSNLLLVDLLSPQASLTKTLVFAESIKVRHSSLELIKLSAVAKLTLATFLMIFIIQTLRNVLSLTYLHTGLLA